MEEEATEAVEIEHHEMSSFAGVEARQSFKFQHHTGSFLSDLSVTSCAISYSRFAKTVLYIFLVVTCVPLVAGGAFTSIFIEDGNYNAAVVAFFTACMSLGTTSLFVLHLCGRLELYHDAVTLEGLKLLGMIASVASGISVGVYTILAFIYKQGFSFNGMNYFSSAVFSGIWLASSIELYMVAQWYQSAVQAAKTRPSVLIT